MITQVGRQTMVVPELKDRMMEQIVAFLKDGPRRSEDVRLSINPSPGVEWMSFDAAKITLRRSGAVESISKGRNAMLKLKEKV